MEECDDQIQRRISNILTLNNERRYIFNVVLRVWNAIHPWIWLQHLDVSGVLTKAILLMTDNSIMHVSYGIPLITKQVHTLGIMELTTCQETLRFLIDKISDDERPDFMTFDTRDTTFAGVIPSVIDLAEPLQYQSEGNYEMVMGQKTATDVSFPTAEEEKHICMWIAYNALSMRLRRPKYSVIIDGETHTQGQHMFTGAKPGDSLTIFTENLIVIHLTDLLKGCTNALEARATAHVLSVCNVCRLIKKPIYLKKKKNRNQQRLRIWV
jgi:hypothetical protein